MGYESLAYPGADILSDGKAEVNSVESVNADLRRYLARRSRCFSRSLHALRTALTLFVYYVNRRCLARLAHPTYAFRYPLVT